MTARFVEVICNFDQVVPDIGRRKNPSQTMVRPEMVKWSRYLTGRRRVVGGGENTGEHGVAVCWHEPPLCCYTRPAHTDLQTRQLRYVGDMIDRNIIIFVKL